MDPKLLGNLGIVFAISSAQNDPPSQGDLLGCVMTSDQFFESLAFFISQFDFRRFRTGHSIHLCFQSWHTIPKFAPEVKTLAYLGPNALGSLVLPSCGDNKHDVSTYRDRNPKEVMVWPTT